LRELRYIPALFALCLLTCSLWAGQPNQTDSQVFTGEISDALCAKDGSHEKMMDEMKSMGRDKQSCARKCTQLGTKYVLFDPSKKTVYNLDDQDKADTFAGRKVRVKGTLEKNKIKVSSIEPVD